MGYKVAVVGATGNVGREMLNILDERKFPADEVVALASRRSVGVEVSYGDRTLKVKALEHFDFSDVDICLMSAGGSVSKEWSPKIAAASPFFELASSFSIASLRPSAVSAVLRMSTTFFDLLANLKQNVFEKRIVLLLTSARWFHVRFKGLRHNVGDIFNLCILHFDASRLEIAE